MTAAAQLITDNLDIWASAVKTKSAAGRGNSNKLELYGIKKLRDLILELAVRGLLVPQDPNDEPASELVKRIAAEKAKAVKDGKIKKSKQLLPIENEDKPFDLPAGWSLARLGDLTHVISKGTTPTSVGYTFEQTGVSFIKIENLDRGRIDKNSISQFISENTNNALARSQLNAGDLLFSIAGTIGKTAVVHSEDLPANTNQALAFIRGSGVVFSPDFLRIQLDSFVSDKTRRRARGGAMPNVSLGDLTALVSPVPPIAEQYRIVAKVDELMTLCDQLEQQQETSITAHQTLVQTLLNALTTASERGDFTAAWARIADHFDTLFTTEWSIDQLKQTILQLAVMGKLVPQDPDDEPASELLKKIAAKKATLVKEGKIKKQKARPEITDDEKSFDLPEGWEWLRLGDFSYVFAGNSFKSRDFNDQCGVRVIKITNAGVGELVETNDFLPKRFLSEYESYKVIEGDLILALTRPYISTGLKISSCPSSYNNSLLNQRVAAIRVFLDTSFLYQYMQSAYVLGVYRKRFGSSGLQPNLKMADVTNLVIPVPPASEQQRIVAKIDELMSICDTLNTRLNTAQTTQLQLADAMAEQAVG